MHEFHVEVFFPAAPIPFKQEHTNPQETVGKLLEKVLKAFELTTEGFEYSLRHDSTVLNNLTETIAAVAGRHHHLKLTLARQIVSGGGDAFLAEP